MSANTDSRPLPSLSTTARVSAPPKAAAPPKAVLLKRICLPSGDHATHSAPPGAGVTRRLPEPSAFMTHTPPRAESEV